MTTIAVPTGAVTVGVDTHKDIHVAAVLDEVGRLLGSCGFPTDPAGNAALIGWVEQHGSITRVGVEGTGSYGAQLTRDLQRAGHHVIEVDRPDRKARRLRGKDDHLDAEAPALSCPAEPPPSPRLVTARSRPFVRSEWPGVAA
jgi:transposase